MSSRPLSSVVIVGGGSAGWMTAAALACNIHKDCSLTLIESEEIGTVGVGEATIPPIRSFNQMLGIDEATFLKATKGSFKLGIQFVNWGRVGHRYFHPFGTYGRPFDLAQPHQHWLRADAAGQAAPLDDHCMAWAAAREGRFAPPVGDPRNVLSTYDYAYHFDAGLYAAHLRSYAEARGVRRVEGKIADVALNGETGFVERLTLENGQSVGGQLFIDCSGLRALLIEGALATGFEDWSHWLPCDRALAVPSERGAFTPYTRSTARPAGWQWRIPLQHRTGNGHVYASAFMDDQAASDLLMAHLEDPALADPRPIRFRTGRRRKLWNRNVIAVGLASGFLEPLESTSLHLVQTAISKILAFFPDQSFDPMVTDEFNRISITEYERIRDFIILHYKLTERDDSALWRYCAAMPIPDTLAHKIRHFRHAGRLIPSDMALFGPPSWLAVHMGQFNRPETLDPMITYREVDSAAWMARMRGAMDQAALGLPTHEAYVARLCAEA